MRSAETRLVVLCTVAFLGCDGDSNASKPSIAPSDHESPLLAADDRPESRPVTALVQPPRAQASRRDGRFSKEAVTLLEQITQAYDLDGKRCQNGNFDPVVLARLAESSDAEIRELAKLARSIDSTYALTKRQGKELSDGLKKQLNEWPNAFLNRVQNANDDPTPKANGIQDAAKLLEDLAGPKLQEAVNKAWIVACFGNELVHSFKGKLRDLAMQAGPAADPSVLIDVEVEANPRPNGAISLVNRTGRDLHHCLVFTRLKSDKVRLQAMAKEEELVGVFILPALGFSPKTVNGSIWAGQLRSMFNQQDKGVVVYVPVIPDGAKVTTLLAQPGYFQIAERADVSLWCDELAVENKLAGNWAKIGPRRADFGQSSNRKNPPGKLRTPTRDPTKALPGEKRFEGMCTKDRWGWKVGLRVGAPDRNGAVLAFLFNPEQPKGAKLLKGKMTKLADGEMEYELEGVEGEGIEGREGLPYGMRNFLLSTDSRKYVFRRTDGKIVGEDSQKHSFSLEAK